MPWKKGRTFDCQILNATFLPKRNTYFQNAERSVKTKCSHRHCDIREKFQRHPCDSNLARPVSSREQTINGRLAAGFRNLWWQIPCSVSCTTLINGRGSRTRDTNPCRVGVIDGAGDSHLFDTLVRCTASIAPVNFATVCTFCCVRIIHFCRVRAMHLK